MYGGYIVAKSAFQVLMPMGGLGSRFAKAGYATPKLMIEVDGKPMFMKALDSFKGISNIQHIFVIRQEHEDAYNLSAQIRSFLPDAKIALLDHDTGGAVETCLVAKGLIDDGLPIIIADCDIYFESIDYFEKVKTATETCALDGMLLTFPSHDSRYSYVEIDEAGKALRTAEKIVISNHAILGGYFFQSGELFKSLADEFMANGLPEGLKEYFMSHLFNLLLARGGVINIANVGPKYIFGTPEELQNYQNGKQ
jgi:NDP-sugar pyrophosphorylase family protein